MRVVQLCRLRSALKLSFAVALALASGFYFQLEIPRWAVVTAVIVIAGPAFVAGQEPYSGAIFHRSLLRVVGTLLGGMVGLLIMFLAARAPVVMLLLCCLWIGVCTWRSSLVRVEYAYAWALSGYTVLSLLSSKSNPLQLKILYWLGGMIRYRLLVRGIFSNCAYLPVESKLLRKTEPAIVKSAEQFSSAINGLRAFVASMTCVAIWGWTGWTSASGFMVVIAVMCSLAMRTTNPQKTGLDFVLGMLIALPLGMFYFLVVLPMTQQNLMLLLISMVLLIFVIGWEGQKKRIGAMGTLMGVLNLLVLSNPMVFNFNAFIDAALGQLIGSLIGYLVILIFPDNSQAVTRRALITCLRREVFHQLRSSVRNTSQLPQMYAYYNRLEQIEPTDVLALNLAMNLIMDYHEMAHENLLRVNAGAEQDAIEVICAKKLG